MESKEYRKEVASHVMLHASKKWPRLINNGFSAGLIYWKILLENYLLQPSKAKIYSNSGRNPTECLINSWEPVSYIALWLRLLSDNECRTVLFVATCFVPLCLLIDR